MKAMLAGGCALVLLGLTTGARAAETDWAEDSHWMDETDDESSFSFGLGLGLRPSDIFQGLAFLDEEGTSFLPMSLSNFYLPMWISSKYRIEPEFGLYREHQSTETSSLEYLYSDESSSKVLRLGTSVGYGFSPDDMTQTYIGLRAGLIRTTGSFKTEEYTSDDSTISGYDSNRTDSFFGLLGGGEYWISEHFSIGTEIQLNWINVGDENVVSTTNTEESDTSEEDDTETTTEDHGYFSNNMVIFFRFYFK